MSGAAERLSAALADRYRIERELGAGGMATVYLAEDLKHDRKVAIKVLKPELAAVLGAERFVVEIKTTAAMSHPHILPLFDSGTADGFLFYVMPYIQGETIREKLNRETQFGVDDAVRIAREVADALDYAHRHGVIHRDIKPENILLHDGRAMVMDFGIALAVSAAAGGRMTETGLSLGTPHYMSPEQATADKEITGRSDVYSLASVLYEMLAGVPPHEGGSAQQTIMRILTDTPRPVTELRRTVPPNVAAALAKALEKLPADRFESARTFADALGNPSFVTSAQATRTPQQAPRLLYALAALSVALAVIATYLALRPFRDLGGLSATNLVYETSIVLPDSAPLGFIGAVPLGVGMQSFTVSPDGTMLVFVGQHNGTSQLYRRALGSSVIEPLPGTEGAYAPFFSPDGKAVAYFARGAVRRTAIDGSATVTLAELKLPYGGTWLSDGRIIVAANEGDELVALPSAGGTPVPVGPKGFRGVFPEPLPGERELLMTTESHQLAVVPLAADGNVLILGPRGPVRADSVSPSTELVSGSHPRYVASGHILYHTLDGAIMALPYEPETHRVLGQPAAVLSGARLESIWGAGQFEVTRDGTLIYARGENGRRVWLVWRDATGKADTLQAFGRDDYGKLDLSPDGNRLLVKFCSNQGRCGTHVLNVHEGVRVALPEPTLQGDRGAVLREIGWNGSQRVYASYLRSDTPDGNAAFHTLSYSPENVSAADSIEGVFVFDVAADGTVLYRRGDSLYTVPSWSSIRQPPTGSAFLIPEPDAWGRQVRPGGEWVAYTSLNQEAGDYVVFIIRTKPPFERWRASPRGGEEPIWDRKGDLVYREGNRWMRVVPPALPGGRPGVATMLFAGPYLNVLGRSHDIAPNGHHLLVAGPSESTAATLTVVTHWLGRLSTTVSRP